MTADVPVPAGQHAPPADAVDAAISAPAAGGRCRRRLRTAGVPGAWHAIAAVLEAAAPHIAAQAAAEEREACALLADYYAEEIVCRECGSEAAYSAATVIRSRGTP